MHRTLFSPSTLRWIVMVLLVATALAQKNFTKGIPGPEMSLKEEHKKSERWYLEDFAF